MFFSSGVSSYASTGPSSLCEPCETAPEMNNRSLSPVPDYQLSIFRTGRLPMRKTNRRISVDLNSVVPDPRGKVLDGNTIYLRSLTTALLRVWVKGVPGNPAIWLPVQPTHIAPPPTFPRNTLLSQRCRPGRFLFLLSTVVVSPYPTSRPEPPLLSDPTPAIETLQPCCAQTLIRSCATMPRGRPDVRTARESGRPGEKHLRCTSGFC